MYGIIIVYVVINALQGRNEKVETVPIPSLKVMHEGKQIRTKQTIFTSDCVCSQSIPVT